MKELLDRIESLVVEREKLATQVRENISELSRLSGRLEVAERAARVWVYDDHDPLNDNIIVMAQVKLSRARLRAANRNVYREVFEQLRNGLFRGLVKNRRQI